MPMSIRFDRQPGLTLDAKRPSKIDPWEMWSHEEARWVDLKGASKALVDSYLIPTLNEQGRDAAAYLQEILPDCDGWHVLILYQHPIVDDKPNLGEVLLGLVRSRVEFKQGQRETPHWTNLAKRSIWERLMRDSEPPPPA